MEKSTALFEDRRDAGTKLARFLSKFVDKDPLIIGIARGGIPVAYEVAKTLHAPLDVVAVRKLRAPADPEYGIGAIAPGDVVILENEAIRTLGLSDREIDDVLRREKEELERRIRFFRSGTWSAKAFDTVILVDDGLATGVSSMAAAESVRLLQKPRTLVFAVPIAPQGSRERLQGIGAEFVCLSEVRPFIAVSIWYKEFPQVSDEEALEYLKQAKQNAA